jgi:hypothetical protein
MSLLPFSLDMPDLFGFYLPPLVLWSLLALLPHVLIRVGLRGVGFYRAVWHPALFDIALYVVILSSTILTIGGARL